MTTIATHAVGAPEAPRAGTFDSSKNRVLANGKVTLSGRFVAPQTTAAPDGGKGQAPAAPVQGVRIQFRALGADNWHDDERTETGRSGRFSEQVEVDRSGRFRAVSADGRSTPAELVRVKSKTRARVADDTVKVGEKFAVKGKVVPAGSRRKVAVRVGGETFKTHTSKGGGFKVEAEAGDVGESTVRVRAASDKIAAGSGDKAGKVAVLRPAPASWYGPGLYGNPMGCGGTLQPDTVGVAHKTLPCGTKLIVANGSKSVKTEVIDRGPYAGGREFDLTEALKNKINFPDVGTVYVSK